jgi:hypothetical protein
MAKFTINTDNTCDFAEHWKYVAPGTTGQGIWVAMEPHHIQFATDWANICIASFMEMIAERQAKKKAALEAASAPKPSSIVLTGADS